MMQMPLPLAKEVVLIGGGHAHALLLRRWGMRPVAGARLTLINPAPTAPYTGMLPGFVAGHYTRDELEIDLVRLARHAGARIIFGKVTGIDRKAQRIIIPGRPPLPYDIASLDIGITSDMPEIPGFADHAVAAKPLGRFAERWAAFRAAGGGDVALIGGGVAGVELALAMRHALGTSGRLAIIDSDRILSGVSTSTRNRLKMALDNADIAITENAEVAQVMPDGVTLANGTYIPAALVVGAAGARPFDWLADTGLDLADGYITVDRHLRSTNDPAIYAAGDCAHLSHDPRPKAGVFAVRAAPVLTDNIQAALTGKKPRNFNPQRQYLKLISLGRQTAVADKWDYSLQGAWAWTWKDRIDRAFMTRLSDLPAMPAPDLPTRTAIGVREALGPKPLCGGCGAKVGPDALDRAIGDLADTARDDIETTSGDDAAVLHFGASRQVISTDHLRAFWDDPFVMARIAALHALGDVWAMGARPQAALAQIILPRMSEAMQETWLAEITAAARAVFDAEGAAIVGGHTTLGPELSLGFTVTGTLDRPPITLNGARPGDALLLTRPLGSGTILAAEMERRARATDVADLIAVMLRSQGDAAACLAATAHAMTDVTGFGLAGHLARMAKASGVSTTLRLADIPLFAGAEALAQSGVRSSIWAANKAAVAADLPDTAPAALLFDPQTAGGLLAALPADTAPETLAAIRDMGHDAALIGHITESRDLLLYAD
jgi:selenide, water dikinase